MTNVAEVKAAINAAVEETEQAQQATLLAQERLKEAAGHLAVAVEGSGHDAVDTARAALFQSDQDLQNGLHGMAAGIEQAQTYVATL
jgi:hypothetical protein